MEAVYRLVGYDKRTETLATRVDIPRPKISEVFRAAEMPPVDPEIGDLELTPAQAQQIGRLINAPTDLNHCDYFLEPYVYA